MKNAMQKLMGLAAFALAAMFGLTASAADVAEVVSADGQAVTGYATLQAAFDAVEAGGTVRLVDNVSLAASSYYTNGVASTFDLAGRTVSVESTASYGAVYVKSGTMTLADTVGTGEITGSATGLRLEGTGKLVMNGGRITITRTATSGTAQGIFLAGQTEATLNGGTVSVTGTQNKVSVYGIYLNGCSGKLSINGARILCTAYTAQSSSSYKSSAIQCNSASADVKVTAGEIYMYGGYNAYGLFISGGSNRSVLISGGNFYAYSSKTSAAAVSGYTANTIITGGNFYSYKYGAVSQAYPVANAIVRGGKFAREVIAAPAYKMQALSPTEEITINDKTVTMTQTVVADPDATPVARVKSTQSTYNSVQEAMEAAAATDTVELMDDASTGFFPVTGWAGKTLTLDLAGHSLDGTGLTGALTGPSAITVYGSLTLTNSVPASGTLVATKFGIYVWSGADFTLAGGKVSVTSTWTSTQCAGITGGGTARVSGGTLQVDGAEPIVAGFYMSAGTFSVSGGNVFVRSTTSGKKGYVSYQGSGSVTGGKFAIETNSGTVSRFYSATVTGGSFTFDPSSYLPLGNKKVVDTGTETVTPFETELTLAYEVVTDPDAPYRAENLTTGTKYYVPQTAIDEARDGETVRMLADVSLNGGYLSITNGITFDLNGHTVTSKTSTVQMTGGTDAQPIRIVDTAAVKGVIAGESAIRAASGAKCHAVVDGVTLFGTLRLFFDESGTSATDRSSLLLTNVTGRVVPNSTASNAYRCGLSAKYSNILLADCDFTVDAPNQKPSKLTTSYYQTMFRFASATASSTVTVDGGSYRVIVGDNAYVNMAAYDASKPNLIVKDGLFAIETGATPQSVCFYAATNTAAIYGSNISLAGGDYTENIDPTQWIVRNRYVADSAIAGYVYHVKELTLENSTAMIVTGDVTNFYMFVTKALEDATAGDVVEVANPSAEAVSLPTGVSLKSNGKFTGTVTSVSPMHKIIETDGVYATVAYTADDAEAMVDCGSVTNYYGALTNAILAANGNGYRVTLLRDIVLGDVPCQAYDSYLEMYIRSLLPEMDTITLDGWDATLGRAHTITDSGSNDWLHAIVSTESVTIENLSFRNMSSSLVEDAFGQLTMRNVDVEGVLYADGNVGVYCTYCWGDATFENCTNRADVVGSGVYTDYDAIFVGYTGSSSYSQTLSFTNCVNAGRAQAGKLAMFIGNPCGSKDLVLNVSGCENRGSLVATFVYENTPLGEYDDYNMNWYMAVDSNCPHIILNGESVDASTLNFENITVDSTHGIVNADGGVVCNGPVETGMRLYELPGKTFHVVPATGNQVTNIAFGSMSDVDYYRVSVGLYVSLAKSSGSSRVYATQTFDANGTNGFETALMNLDFVDLDYVDGAETDLLAGNVTFTTNGVTYYVVVDDDYTTNGEVWEAEFRHVTAFDANRRLLATATLGGPSAAVARNVETGEAYASVEDAVSEVLNGQTVEMIANATLTNSVPCNKSFTLDLNGKTIDGAKYGFVVSASGVVIDDSSAGALGKITNCQKPYTAGEGGAFEVESGASLTLNGGSISGNSSTGSGGAVFVNGGGTFTMNGGRLDGNTATSNGGAVQSSGAFFLNGGVISGNTAGNMGGGVILGNGGSFTMSDGEIINNRATANHGGGVYTEDAVAVVISGGSITNNYSKKQGGGVMVHNASASLTITGGIICDNEAADHGGGINARCPLTMSGTVLVAGNTSAGHGGGIYANNTVSIDGDITISNNTCSVVGKMGGGMILLGGSYAKSVGGNVRFADNTASQGGGLCLYGCSGTMTLSNATFENNTATADGGGIYVYGGNLAVTDSIFVGNAANGTTGSGNYPGAGGGIYARNGRALTLTDVRFENNTSKWGAGLYPMGTTTINGAAFTNNVASISGGAIYSGNNGVLTINDCSIDVSNVGNSQVLGKGIWATASSSIILKGGTYAASVNMDGVAASCAVTGGRFSAPITCTLTKTILPIVTGGVYTDSAKDGVTDGLVPDEYAFVANTDEATKEAYPWMIAPDSAHIAMIGDVKYETLGLAMADAKAGDTVKLINPTDESVEMATGVKFDKNSKEYTGTLSAPDGSFIRDNGDGTYDSLVLIAEVITATATNNYETIAKALAAVGDGETVVLMKSGYAAEPALVVSRDVAFAFDLNGLTLKTDLTVSGGALTLTNGILRAVTDGVAAVTVAGGSLTLAEGADVKGATGIAVNAGSFYSVGGKAASTNSAAVIFARGTSATVAGGTFIGADGEIALGYADLGEGAHPTNFVWAALDAEGAETGYPLFNSEIPAAYIAEVYRLKDNLNGTWTVTAGSPEIKVVTNDEIVPTVTNSVPDLTSEESEAVSNDVSEIHSNVMETLKDPENENLTGTGVETALTKTNEVGMTILRDYTFDALTNQAATADIRAQIKTNSTVTSYVKVELEAMEVLVSTNATESESRIIESTLNSITYDVKPIVTTVIMTNEVVVTVKAEIPEGTILAEPITFRLWLEKTFTASIAKVTHKHGEEIVDIKDYIVRKDENGTPYIDLTWNQFSIALVEARSQAEYANKACWVGTDAGSGVLYDTVADALVAAETSPNAQIWLLKDNSETVALGNDQTIYLDGHAFTGTLTAIDGTEMVRSADGATVYRAPEAISVPTGATTTMKVRGYADYPAEVTTKDQKAAYLAEEDAYGRPRWQTYVLGANAKLIPEIVASADPDVSTVVIRAANGFTVNTPAKSGVSVKFNLLTKAVGDPTFVPYGDASVTPSFQVDVNAISDKTLWKIQTVFESDEAQ